MYDTFFAIINLILKERSKDMHISSEDIFIYYKNFIIENDMTPLEFWVFKKVVENSSKIKDGKISFSIDDLYKKVSIEDMVDYIHLFPVQMSETSEIDELLVDKKICDYFFKHKLYLKNFKNKKFFKEEIAREDADIIDFLTAFWRFKKDGVVDIYRENHDFYIKPLPVMDAFIKELEKFNLRENFIQ